jgi:hypothetical protein
MSGGFLKEREKNKDKRLKYTGRWAGPYMACILNTTVLLFLDWKEYC